MGTPRLRKYWFRLLIASWAVFLTSAVSAEPTTTVDGTPSQRSEARSAQTESSESSGFVPAHRVSFQHALYTRKARSNRTEGHVLLRLHINKKGRVDKVELLEGLPDGLDKSAVRAAKKWRFDPATLNGQAIESQLEVKLDFRLQPIQAFNGETMEAAVIQPPKKTYGEPPPRFTGVDGLVVIEAEINEKGRVTDARVVDGINARVDEAALSTVQSWRFEPATLNGQPITVQHQVTLRINSR